MRRAFPQLVRRIVLATEGGAYGEVTVQDEV
jgi:hypothetical protein